MVIQVLFYKSNNEDLHQIVEVNRLRKDGTFFKWLTKDIMTWISKPGRTITILKVFDDDK